MSNCSFPSDFWPRPLAHLARPYLQPVDERVIVAEITDTPVNGYEGMRQLYSALVPLAEIDCVMQTLGGIGWEVRSWGPDPIVPPEGGWHGRFWVSGGDSGEKRYEALVHGWQSHNQTVMAPDNAFMMCYGLMPRFPGDGRILWDDLSKPAYDVVEVRPVSLFEVPRSHSPAGVRIYRRYLEDFASLKGCAVVAVFYEERFSRDDPDVYNALQGSEAEEYKLPGRRLLLKRVSPELFNGANQLLQVWGCRLILKPEGRPITEESDPLLRWPGFEDSLSPQNLPGLRPFDYVYVKDEALLEWEDRAEFTIFPMSGGVGYGGRWSTAYTRRVGRHHIAMELKKLYEGLPAGVIQHFHRFAVPKAEMERDRERYGDRHVGQRAEDIVESFLGLVESLAAITSQLNLPVDQEEFCGLTGGQVEYRGWWDMDELKALGRVIPIAMTEGEFLARCMLLYKVLFERLRPGPLKQLLHALGLPKDKFKDLGALGLLGTLCHLAELARAKGLSLFQDFPSLLASWDKDRRLASLTPVFALVALRNLYGHAQGKEWREKFHAAISSLGLDAMAMRGGWGLGLDQVYDNLIVALRDLRALLRLIGE